MQVQQMEQMPRIAGRTLLTMRVWDLLEISKAVSRTFMVIVKCILQLVTDLTRTTELRHFIFYSEVRGPMKRRKIKKIKKKIQTLFRFETWARIV